MSRFEQFLMEKRVIEFVDYVNTLSESQAAEILEGLDDDTLDLIESVLSENLRRDTVTKQPIYGKTGVKAYDFSHKSRDSGGQPPEDIGDADSGSVLADSPRKARKAVAAFGAKYKREVDAGKFVVQPDARPNPVKFHGLSRLEKKKLMKSGEPSSAFRN